MKKESTRERKPLDAVLKSYLGAMAAAAATVAMFPQSVAALDEFAIWLRAMA
jgi:hypothetical protein